MSFIFELFSGTLINAFAQAFVFLTRLPATLLQDLVTNIINTIFSGALATPTTTGTGS